MSASNFTGRRQSGHSVFLFYILQLWWVGWGLRDVDVWAFLDFIVLIIGSIFLYGAAEMALPAPEESKIDMLEQSKGLGRLSAASMLLYFLVGPYVNISMYGNAIIPSIAVPSVGCTFLLGPNQRSGLGAFDRGL